MGFPAAWPWLWRNIQHLILQSNYTTQTELVNSVTVISEDDNHNLLIGKAYSGNGDKNINVQRPDLITQADVDAAAQTILDKQDTNRAVIYVPYNFGAEIYDVVQTMDKHQTAGTDYRVIGQKVVIDNLNHKYYLQLALGGV